MQDTLIEKCKKYQKHFSELLEIGCKIVDIPGTSMASLMPENEQQDFCAGCRYENKNELSTHLYGCHEAHRWNGKYIYYCPIGLTFIAASISGDEGELIGGLVLGPIIMGDMQDTLYDLPIPEMKWKVSRLTEFSTQDVHHLAEIFSGVTSFLSISERKWFQTLTYDQEKMLKAIYINKDRLSSDDEQSAEIFKQFERKLRIAVVGGEKEAALNMINEMLAQIYVYSGFDYDMIRAKLLDVLVVFSRAMMDAGIDPAETLRMSEEFIVRVDEYSDADQLAVWISDVVHYFAVQAFDIAQVKHSDAVYKITNYIKKHSTEKLTLEQLAQEVFLSRSYLSNIFKQETGMSLTSYITRLRIEKSRRLLTETTLSLVTIAIQCGFKDQSYFTKVFRKETGLSPRQFRIRTSTLPRPAHRRPYKRRNKDGTVDENIGATAEASAPDAEAAKPKKGKKAKAAKEPPKGKAEPKQKKPNKPKKSKSQKAK